MAIGNTIGGKIAAVTWVVAVAALALQDFGALHDGPTHISAAQFNAATAEAPSYCDVRATIFPKIGVAVQLPAQNWNAKLLELGCGSFCGSLELADCAGPTSWAAPPAGTST